MASKSKNVNKSKNVASKKGPTVEMRAIDGNHIAGLIHECLRPRWPVIRLVAESPSGELWRGVARASVATPPPRLTRAQMGVLRAVATLIERHGERPTQAQVMSEVGANARMYLASLTQIGYLVNGGRSNPGYDLTDLGRAALGRWS